ncbi:MAG: protein kinase domain-containing protein, partial [Planctomycetota bacterium]
MGVVYKAFHPQLKRTVALKVLIAGEDASEEAIARFHREAEAVAKLGHHPNIVPVYDIGAEGNRHYFAMHYVEGRPLDRTIDEGNITSEQAAAITKKLAEALAHAHAHGILHRDVKPANVLMGSFEGERGRGGEGGEMSLPPSIAPSPPRADRTIPEPMLTDFGLAKDVTSESAITCSGVTLGTPQYMAPEQADGRLDDVDERSDVYSLGVVLYEMLAFRPPFDGAAVIEVIQKVLLHEPVSPRRFNRLVDPDVEIICLQCLEKDPNRRYASAEALARDLGRYLEGKTILARPAPLWLKIAKRARRNRAAAAALAALALLCVVGSVLGVLAVTSWSRERAEKDEARAETQKAVTKAGEVKGERDRAKRLLKKSLRASQVLLAAYTRLGEINARLTASFHDSSMDTAAKREVFRKAWPEIEAYYKTVSEDPVDQATLLALLGWLFWHGPDWDKARRLFERAKAADEEVMWGHLFEAMSYLSEYLQNLAFPNETIDSEGSMVSPSVPAETEVMRRASEKFESALEAMVGDSLWEDQAGRKYRGILESFRALREGDLEEAETVLTGALAVPEMAVLRGEILFYRAKIRYLRRKTAEALVDLEDVLKARPRSASVHFCAGQVHLARGVAERAAGRDPRPEYEQALVFFDRALSLAPKYVFARINRGLVRKEIGDAELVRGGDPEPRFHGALEDYTRALDDVPDHTVAYNNRGLVFESLARLEGDRGRDPRPLLDKAMADFDRALEINPDYLIVFNNRALVYGRLAKLAGATGGDPFPWFDKAIEGYTRFLEERPESTPCLRNRAVTWGRLGAALLVRGRDPRAAFEMSLEDFSILLLAHPEDPELYNGRGNQFQGFARALHQMQMDPVTMYKKAAEDYSEAIRHDATYLPAHNNRGNSYLNLAQIEEASEGDPEPWFEKAVADFSAVLEREPENAQALANRGNTYTAMAKAASKRGGDAPGLYRKALEDCERAVRADPRLIDGHYFLANASAGLGSILRAGSEDPRPALEKAVAAFRAFLRLQAGAPYALNNLALALIALGEENAARGGESAAHLEEALKFYGEAAKVNPRLWQPFANRGNLLAKLGRFEEARDDLEKAYRLSGGQVASLKILVDEVRTDCQAPAWYRVVRTGLMAVTLGDYRKAHEWLERGLREA